MNHFLKQAHKSGQRDALAAFKKAEEKGSREENALSLKRALFEDRPFTRGEAYGSGLVPGGTVLMAPKGKRMRALLRGSLGGMGGATAGGLAGAGIGRLFGGRTGMTLGALLGAFGGGTIGRGEALARMK